MSVLNCHPIVQIEPCSFNSCLSICPFSFQQPFSRRCSMHAKPQYPRTGLTVSARSLTTELSPCQWWAHAHLHGASTLCPCTSLKLQPSQVLYGHRTFFCELSAQADTTPLCMQQRLLTVACLGFYQTPQVLNWTVLEVLLLTVVFNPEVHPIQTIYIHQQCASVCFYYCRIVVYCIL